MNTARWKPWALGAVILGATYSVVAQTPKPTPVDFGNVEIGDASQPRPVTVTNSSDKALDLHVVFSDTGSSEFSETHDCPKSLAVKQSCEIKVRFAPKTASSKDQPTTATMQVPDLPAATLKGVGVPNFKVSPEQLAFGNQLVNTSSAPRAITVTNNTGKSLSNIDVVVTGEFTETHTGCQTLNAGASCAVSVVFAPKHSDSVGGALTVSVKPGDNIIDKKTVNLNGAGVQRCNPVGISCGWGTWTVLIVCGGYFLGMVLVRWNMIARPTRLQLRTQIMSVQARMEEELAALPPNEPNQDKFARLKEQVEKLLRAAVYLIKTTKEPFDNQERPRWWTRWGNALFWTRGHELAGWSLVHEAEEQLVALLPIERVRARMETAEQQLRGINTPAALALADRLRDSAQSGDVILQEKLRKLLTQCPILQQPEVPAAAQHALLANTISKASGLLNRLITWAQASTTPATALNACQKSLIDFQQKFADWSAVQQEINRLLQQWPAMPQVEQAVLRSAMNFLAGPFATAYQNAGAQTDLNACNAVLGALAQLQGAVQPIVNQLAGLAQQSQDVAALQAFLQKSATQTDLLASIASALTPLQSTALLQQIQALLNADHTLSQQLTTAAAATSTDDVSKLRALLEPFAFSLPLAQDLAAKIKCELDCQAPSVLARWRALLMEALGLIYDRADTDFSQLAAWHNKLIWLVFLALIFILALAITFQNPALLLLGAVGGLLSRLSKNLEIADVENDYGASWGAIFLSPVTGALSAWGGILLIILGKQLNILGSALNLDWCNPFDPAALAIALLFGFSERWFDDVAQKIVKSVSAPSSSATAQPTATPGAAPTIANVDPLPASAGKENKLNVHGTNFKTGASASFTDDTGKAVATNAKVDFKDSSNLIVSFTPPAAASAYKLTLKITNPDGSTATLPGPIQVNP
jgi:hypothetical protein